MYLLHGNYYMLYILLQLIAYKYHRSLKFFYKESMYVRLLPQEYENITLTR